MDITITHHIRQMKTVRDRKTCLLFATKLGTLAKLAQHEAAQMRERMCRCGTVIESSKVKMCPGCGREL